MGIVNWFTGRKNNINAQTKATPGASPFAVAFGFKDTPDLNETTILRTYGSSPWVRAVCDKIGFNVSIVEWYLQKKGSDVEIDEHEILDLLKGKNTPFTTFESNLLLITWLELRGFALLVKERSVRGKITGLWPVSPDAVTHTILDSDNRQPIAYVVTLGTASYEIPAKDVIVFKYASPLHTTEYSSPMQSLGDEIQLDEYCAKYSKTFFFNRATPELLITGEGLTKSDTERLENNWKNTLTGWWNAYKPYFLNKKIDVHKLNTDFKDTNIILLRNSERDIILSAYGIPPEIMGIVLNSNRSTITESNYIFMRHVVFPRVVLMQQAIQKRLIEVDYKDSKLELKYYKFIPDDLEIIRKILASHPYAFTIDEIRGFAGYKALNNEYGDTYPQPPGLIYPIDPKTGEMLHPNASTSNEEGGKTSGAGNEEKPTSGDGDNE